ncbi:protein MIS12 homolog [Erpetoichthys calabaricus]|uniref:Protein MIS12 homolog n=1 Tax=Erpetoichthys calabaricus TaxID=27687 RepID=A0A8C4S5H1_ERPCA|nr:protein MIS12 homolog [Erpetoichthys calabaricus]
MAESSDQVSVLSPEMAKSLQLYEAQFFGFTTQSSMHRIHNAFQDCLYEVMMAVETVILKNIGGFEDDNSLANRVRECTQKFLIFLQGRVDLISNRIECILKDSVFKVPPNVLLPEDASHAKYPCGKENIAKIEDELAKLQQRYQAELYTKQALLAEMEQQSLILAMQEEMINWIKELRSADLEGGIVGLYERLYSVMQTISHLSKDLQKCAVPP